MSSGTSSSPAGSPSTIAVRPGPCDSPAVTKRNDMTPTPYKRGCGRHVGGGTTGRYRLEGHVRRTGPRVRIGGARVERVHRPVIAGAGERRDHARCLAAPGRVGATGAVAVQVVDRLVHLGD